MNGGRALDWVESIEISFQLSAMSGISAQDKYTIFGSPNLFIGLVDVPRFTSFTAPSHCYVIFDQREIDRVLSLSY